ncbi:MAG TPA: 50S ribosomal protein L11 methyltransferase [Bryobacteraceae bacterium]|jgi:ribosomal protein L11 methyltransferase
MYSLCLICSALEVDGISAELWEARTAGIHETEDGEHIVLIASFEGHDDRFALLARFARYSPTWQHEEEIDWLQKTRLAWPARETGDRIFLAPPWNDESTPPGRLRVIHNPGLACGTGEHACSQLALIALEERVTTGTRVVDVGTGSGILAIAALRLGAESAIAVDIDEAGLAAAKENFELNALRPVLVAGSADCLSGGCADVTVANMNADVLVSILDELARITRKDGWLILTGFLESEAAAFKTNFPSAKLLANGEWRCVMVRI